MSAIDEAGDVVAQQRGPVIYSSNESLYNWPADPAMIEEDTSAPLQIQSPSYNGVITMLVNDFAKGDSVETEAETPSLCGVLHDQCFLFMQAADNLFHKMWVLQNKVSGPNATAGTLVG